MAIINIVPEIVINPEDSEHEPVIAIMARGGGYEIVRASAYYSQHTDGNGNYRRRRQALVAFRRVGEPLSEDDTLWFGSYAATKMEDCPRLGEIASSLGIPPMELVEFLRRGRTILLE